MFDKSGIVSVLALVNGGVAAARSLAAGSAAGCTRRAHSAAAAAAADSAHSSLGTESQMSAGHQTPTAATLPASDAPGIEPCLTVLFISSLRIDQAQTPKPARPG